MTGNKDIAEYGKNTRFGQPGGPDPKESAAKAHKVQNKPWSVRHSSKYIAAKTVEEVKDMAANPDKLTVAQAVAIAKMKKAMSGDTKAMQQFTDDVDGKLVDRKVHAEITLADLVTGSLDYDDEFSKDGVIDAEYETSQEADSTVEA